MQIDSPRRQPDHPDYQLDLEEAIDLPLREFVDAVIQAGWKPETVFAAVESVARNQAIAYAEDPDPAYG